MFVFPPVFCVGCTVGVAYEMPTSEVSNINPKRIEKSAFTEISDRMLRLAYNT